MTTTRMALTPEQLDQVRPGDRLLELDDVVLGMTRVFTGVLERVGRGDAIGIPYRVEDSTIEGHLYPDTHVERSIVVEREVADPEPAPVTPAPPTVFLHERERKALMRNPHYAETLRLLSHPTGAAVNLRTRVAAESRANYFGPRYYSHQAGMLATWYGWCERSDVADYTWRLTDAGRRVLAALDAGMGGRRR